MKKAAGHTPFGRSQKAVVSVRLVQPHVVRLARALQEIGAAWDAIEKLLKKNPKRRKQFIAKLRKHELAMQKSRREAESALRQLVHHRAALDRSLATLKVGTADFLSRAKFLEIMARAGFVMPTR